MFSRSRDKHKMARLWNEIDDRIYISEVKIEHEGKEGNYQVRWRFKGRRTWYDERGNFNLLSVQLITSGFFKDKVSDVDILDDISVTAHMTISDRIQNELEELASAYGIKDSSRATFDLRRDGNL